MPAIGRMRRRYAKAQMKRLGEGGSLVSDVERQREEQSEQQSAAAALGAQEMQLGQVAKAQTGGGVFQAQPFLQARGIAAEKAGDAAVKATGQARLRQAQVSDARKGQALSLAGELHDINRKNAKGALDTVKWFTELDEGSLGDMWGAAKNFVTPGGP